MNVDVDVDNTDAIVRALIDKVQANYEDLAPKVRSLDKLLRELRLLMDGPAGTLNPKLLLSLYFSFLSTEKTAAFVNSKGWRIPDGNGQVREITEDDVDAVLSDFDY
ncbi:hypothetical protein LP416_27880 [Polaromonas sp. P2-4]|nr:hypothetical protein LP416_27880 [Polaromonas sp. P2-4]